MAALCAREMLSDAEQEGLEMVELALYRCGPVERREFDVKRLALALGRIGSPRRALGRGQANQMRAYINAVESHPLAIRGWRARIEWRGRRRVAIFQREAPLANSASAAAVS